MDWHVYPWTFVLACWSSSKLESFHRYVACSCHYIAEKLLSWHETTITQPPYIPVERWTNFSLATCNFWKIPFNITHAFYHSGIFWYQWGYKNIGPHSSSLNHVPVYILSSFNSLYQYGIAIGLVVENIFFSIIRNIVLNCKVGNSIGNVATQASKNDPNFIWF